MQEHEQEAWTKYLLPVPVLVTAFGFVFGMLERNFSVHSEAVQTGIEQKAWETTGRCSDQFTATSCTWAYSAWAWNCDLGPHVPVMLLMVCDHYTLLCLPTRCFHVQSIFFKVDFLQLKEGANENIWKSFPFFGETDWFQHLTYLLPLPTAWYSKGVHTGSVLPGAACSAVLLLSSAAITCTVIAQPSFHSLYQPCVVYVPLNLSCLISFIA